MWLVVVVIILLIWVLIKLKESLTPPVQKIDDIEEHLKIVQLLPNQKARQKYLKSLHKRK